MLNSLLEPFTYLYMQKAMLVCFLVGGVCGFLSSYLMVKGWSLIGDAMSHSVVPGVALSYIFATPYVLGSFFTGALAALSMFFIRQKTKLKQDVVIGVVFTSFLALGVLIASLNPISVNVNTIFLGNILAISNSDVWQIVTISIFCLGVLLLKWRDFMAVFFDEAYARTIGLSPVVINLIFFVLLSGLVVSALQVVGAFLVIAMVITPGAAGYMLTNKFGKLLGIAFVVGAFSGSLGVYLSFFLNIHSGGAVVILQTLVFLIVFLFSPTQGLLFRQKRL